MDQREELIALLQYMVDHNTSHTEELRYISPTALGRDALPEFKLAVENYDKGNEHLKNALSALKGE